MTEQELVERFRDPVALAAALGIVRVSRAENVNRSRIGCPLHRDSVGVCALNFVERAGSILWFCPTCEKGGGVIKLASLVWGKKLPGGYDDVIRGLCRLAGVDPADVLGPVQTVGRKNKLAN